MSTTMMAKRPINQVDSLKASRAAKGVKPGVYANDDELMSDYEAEAQEADKFLEKTAELSLDKIAAIRPGRPAIGAGHRVDLVLTSVKLPQPLVAQIKAMAQENKKSYGQMVRELLGGALGLMRGKSAP